MRSSVFILFASVISWSTFCQTMTIDIPKSKNILSENKGSELARGFDTKLIKLDYGYALMNKITSYSGSSTPQPVPFTVKMDNKRNITLAERITLPTNNPKLKESYEFMGFRINPKQSYILFKHYLNDGFSKIQLVAYFYLPGSSTVDYSRPIVIKEFDSSKRPIPSIGFYEDLKFGKCLIHQTDYANDQVEISVYNLSERIQPNPMPLKIVFRANRNIASLLVKDFKTDINGNYHLIYQEVKKSKGKGKTPIEEKYAQFYLFHNVSTKRTTISNLGDPDLPAKPNAQIGTDDRGNSYLFTIGNFENGAYNSESCLVIKFDKDGKLIKKVTFSIPYEDKFRYVKGNKKAFYKEKSSGILNTTSWKNKYEDIKFSISKDGSTAAFIVKDASASVGAESSIEFLYSSGFYFIGFKTSTLEVKNQTLGRNFGFQKANIGEEYIFEGSNSIALLFYNDIKNFNPDDSQVDPSKISGKLYSKPNELGLYTWALDSKLNFKTEQINNPKPTSILFLPPLKVTQNEYLLLISEDEKFRNFKFGMLNVKL